MDVKAYADLAHDGVVEAAFAAGFFSVDQAHNRAFFERVHRIIWRCIEDALRQQRHELLSQFVEELEYARSVLIVRFSEPSRS